MKKRWLGMIIISAFILAACTAKDSSNQGNGSTGSPASSDPADTGAKDAAWIGCMDQGAHPQYTFVEWQLIMQIGEGGYAIRITDSAGHMRRFKGVGKFIKDSDADGAYFSDVFQKGNDTVQVKSYADFRMIISENSGPKIDMVCLPSGRYGNLIHQKETDMSHLQGRWCNVNGDKTTAYTFKMVWGSDTPYVNPIVEDVFSTSSPTTPISTRTGTWEVDGGQLTIKFSDGTTRLIPEFWLEYRDPYNLNTLEWTFNFPDHRELFDSCPLPAAPR